MCFPSKDVGSRNIGTNMSMILDTRKSRFVSQQWLQFHIWFICYRMRQILLQLLYYYFSIVCQVGDYRKWLKLSCRPFAFTSYKIFLKNKKRSGTSIFASFSAWFFKKNFSVVIFYYLTKFQYLLLLREVLGNMCIIIVC